MQLRQEVKLRLRGALPWSTVIEQLEHEVNLVEGREAKAAALYALGEVCEDLLLRKDRAMVHYQASFKTHPQDAKALVRAREIYREMGNLKMVGDLLALELRSTQDPARRGELQGRLGVAQLDQGQLDKAIANLEAAMRARPGDPLLIEAYAAAAHDRNTWLDDLGGLTDQALGSEPARAAELFLRIARILKLEAPGDPRFEEALRAVLGYNIQHEQANFLLEGWLGDAQRFDEIMQLHEERGEAATDETLRAELNLHFASTWALRFADLERAAYFYHKALVSIYSHGLTSFPSHLAAFNFIREMLGARGAWEEVLQLADAALAHAFPEDDLVILATQAGLIAWQQLGDLERARHYFERVNELHPDSPVVLAFVEAYTGGQAPVEAAPAHAAAHDDAAQHITERTTPVAEPVHHEPSPVIEPVELPPLPTVVSHTPVVEVHHAPPPVAPVHVEPARPVAPPPVVVAPPPVVAHPPVETGAAGPAAAVADHAAPLGSDEVSPQIAEAMAAARAAEGAGPEKGVDAWKRLVHAHPTLRPLRAEYARVLRAAEKWNLLVEVLKEQAEKLPGYSTEEKIASLFQLVDIYRERLRLDVMAMNSLNAIVALDPHNHRALDALIGQFEHMKRWPDLINTLVKKANLAAAGEGEAGDDPVAIYSRIATLYQEKFSNAAEAIKAYEKVLEFDAHNLAAIAFLKANYEKRRDWEKLIAVYQREIALVEDAGERGAKFIEVAKLASEKLKKPSVSIELWSKVLDAQPDHPEALAELEKLYEREKHWDKLADVLERQAHAATDAQKKVALLQKLGVLFTDRVNDADRAIEAWRALLAVEPENKRAQEALKKLYTTQKRWDDLEAFYAAQHKYDEYIRVLERQVETEDDATKVVLNTRIAELYRDQLGKPDRAMRAYEKVLSLDGQNLAAAEALIPLYEAAKDPKKLVAVLEIQLGHTPADEGALRLDRMRRLVELSETQLREKPAAFGWALRAFAEAPTEAWTREDAERLARETAAFAELVSAYEQACQTTIVDASEKLPLLLVIAAVYEAELINPERALEVNREILAIDENNPQAIDALERLYLQTQQYPALLEIYEKKLQLETDPITQKEIRYRIASLFEEDIKDPERAVGAYMAILVQNGDELPALRALDRIYTQTGRHRELAELIPRELLLVDAADTATTVDLKYRLGLLRERLGDLLGALECHRDILDLDPANTAAREVLERLLHDGAQVEYRLTIASILEPIYVHLGQHAKLVEIYEIQLGHETDSSGRLSLLLRIGELHAQALGDLDAAFEAYSRAFREEPSDATARAELERVAAAQDNWAPLVALYQGAIDDTGRRLDGALLRELLIKIAGAYDEKLGQSEKAVEYYRRAQAIEPDDTTALEALEKLYTRHERWPELLETYRRKVDLTSDAADREAIYFRMATLWEEMLGNVDEAIATYKEVLGQDDANLRALKALDRLYQVKNAWHELADNLQRQLALTEDRAETVELLVRLAGLREHQLAEVAAAVDTYRQVLELQPDNVAATEALERLVRLPEHELSVAQILEPIYRARDEWRKLVDVYEIMVRHALDPLRKIELLHAIGELYEVGEEGEKAFATYARALAEDPGLADTQTRLERLARAFGRWQDLVTLYVGLLEAGSLDADLQVALWTRVAQIQEQFLRNDADAAAAYLRVLHVDPANLDAANSLEALYLRTESYTQLVEIVLHKVEMVQGVDDKKALCFKAAQIYEEVLDNPEKAIEVFRRVLAIDENDRTSIDSLERLYIRLSQWEDLKDVYGKKAELAGTVEEKKEIYYVLGQVYDQELKDKARAIDTYTTVLELDPEDHLAITALDRLYGETGRWYDLLQVLEREVELAPSTMETVGLKYRIGQLWEKELKDLTRSVEAYRETLALDGTHEPTLRALDGIVHGAEEPVLAAQVLEPIFESAAEWEKLIDVYEVMVRHAEDRFRRVELLHRIAELYERQLDRGVDAFGAFGRALRDDATNETTIAHLERLAGETSHFAALAGLYEDEVKKLLEPSQQVEMLLRLARVYEEELARGQTPEAAAATEKAIQTYRRVLDVEGDQRAAILSLDRLYHATARWKELADILRDEIRLAETDDAIIALQFRLGQLYETELKDVDRAIEVYRDILGARPDHAPTLQAMEFLFSDGVRQLEVASILEPLYRVAEEWQKLVQIHVAQLERMTDPQDRQQMLQRIAELCEQKLVDVPDVDGRAHAFHYWSQALREAPLAELPGEEVERLARDLGAWGELVSLYGEILAAHVAAQGLSEPAPGDETARAILLKLARVHEEELADVARAEDAYQRVLQIDEKDATALAALDRVYLGAQMFAELASVLARRIGITNVTDEQIELYLRLGQVHAEALNDLDNAIAAYNAVLELDSRNRAALEALERIYRGREAHAALYATYEKLLDVASGDAEMAECYAQMAALAAPAFAGTEGAQAARDRAIDLWGRVIDLRGEDPTALAHLAALHEEAGNWRELVDILERQIRISPMPEDQIALYAKLGGIWREKLERDREALDAWYSVLQLDPIHVQALRAVAEIHRANLSWDDLVDTLQRLIEAGNAGQITEEEVKESWAEIGRVQGEINLRPQDAIDAWRRVLEFDRRDFRALAALESLFTQEARWEECIEALEHKARVLDDEKERIAVLMQAASVWEEKVGDLAKAGGVYERVLQAEGTNLAASVALENIYRNLPAWEKLTDLLLQRTEFVDKPARIELFQQMAQIYEREMGDREGAFVVLQAAFKEDFANPTTARELERIATITNKWSELVGEYTQVVQGINDPKIAADLWVKIGRWYGEHLGHLDYAIASEKQALALAPDNKDALAQLADFYRKTSRWQDLADVLAKHAALEDEPQKRVELLLAMADLSEGQLGDGGGAIRAYREAIAADPACVDALNALERLYRRNEQWPELIDVLGRKAGVVDDPDAVIAIKHQIGQLQDERTNDTARAIATYKDILNADTQNVQAMKALERLYDRTGQMESYLEVLDMQLDVTMSDAERVSIHERQAKTWEERFRRNDRAAETLEKILVIDERRENVLGWLERLYRQDRRFADLVDVLRRHINVAPDGQKRIELYAQMGEVYEVELKDPDRAIEAYNDILTFNPDHVGALAALGRLYERVEDWNRAVDVMARTVQLATDKKLQVELHYRIGRINEERIGETDTAEARYVEALSLDPGHLVSMYALTNLYQQRGDMLKAAQMMVRSEGFTQNTVEKVKLLHEAGRIYLQHLEDPQKATELFAEVLQHDPEHVESGEPLADMWFKESEAGTPRWNLLEPVLDMLVRKADKRQSAELNVLYYRLARTADALGNTEKALKYYRLAYELDQTFLPTLVGRAALLFRQQDWEGAFKIYQAILVSHRDAQTSEETVDIYHRLGVIKTKQNDQKKALNFYEKALEIDPSHRPTLTAVIDLQAKAGDYEAVIAAKRSLMPVADENERFKLYEEIGDLYRDKVKNPASAIEAYNEALDLKPDNHQVLQDVLELYVETKQWQHAVDTLQRFADLETKSLVIRGKYYEAAAKIMRDELHDADAAIDYFNKSLDSFFENGTSVTPANVGQYLKPFEAIDRIVTTAKDWKNQERAYRKMIKRLPAEGLDSIKIALWHALGEIYRSRLKDFGSAISAFDVAAKLDPQNVQRREILAELYVMAGPEMAPKAVGEHMALLKQDPFRIESYRALRKLYMDMRQYDRAWCMCNALVFLQKADTEENAFFEQYRQKGFVRVRQPVTDELWAKLLMHPDEDRYVGAVFAAIWQAVAMARSAEHKAFGLRRKDKLDLANHQALFSKVFYYVAQALAVPLPEVYLRPEQPGGMQLANCREKNMLLPSVVVGAELLQGRSDKELVFPIASFLTRLRPEHYMKMVVQTNSELRVWFLAALKLTMGPKFPVPPAEAQVVDQALAVLNQPGVLHPAMREQLAHVVQRFLQAKADINLNKWSQAVDLTADRAAFVLSNDLALAARFVQMQPTMVGGMQSKEKVKELVVYATSEAYFDLRQQLGLAIG